MEDDLPDGFPSELMLVLEGDLYLIPFPVLKGTNCTDFLCERFSLMVTPSLTSMKTRYPKPRLNGILEEDSKALVVANPRIPTSVTEHWGWADIPKVGPMKIYKYQHDSTVFVPQAEEEAGIVGEILQSEPLTGSQATKEVSVTI